VKTGYRLVLPGIIEYEIEAEIYGMQLEPTYSEVAEDEDAVFLFDPDKYHRDDPTLVTSNY